MSWVLQIVLIAAYKMRCNPSCVAGCSILLNFISLFYSSRKFYHFQYWERCSVSHRRCNMIKSVHNKLICIESRLNFVPSWLCEYLTCSCRWNISIFNRFPIPLWFRTYFYWISRKSSFSFVLTSHTPIYLPSERRSPDSTFNFRHACICFGWNQYWLHSIFKYSLIPQMLSLARCSHKKFGAVNWALI